LTAKVSIETSGHYVKVTMIEGENRFVHSPTNVDHYHYVWPGRSLLIEEVPLPPVPDLDTEETVIVSRPAQVED
jgi:hypothetical protein